MIEAQDYIAGLALLITIFNIFWTGYRTARDRSGAELAAIRDEQKKLDEQQIELRGQLKQIDMAMNSMPSAAQLHALELSVAKVEGGMSTLAETIKPIARSVQRIDEFLMKAAAETGRGRR